MELYILEKQLVAATVALANAATLEPKIPSKRLRQQPRPTAGWQKFMQLCEAINARIDAAYLVYAPSGKKGEPSPLTKQSREVHGWLEAIAKKQDIDNLPDVLHEYIRGIRLGATMDTDSYEVAVTFVGAAPI